MNRHRSKVIRHRGGAPPYGGEALPYPSGLGSAIICISETRYATGVFRNLTGRNTAGKRNGPHDGGLEVTLSGRAGVFFPGRSLIKGEHLRAGGKPFPVLGSAITREGG